MTNNGYYPKPCMTNLPYELGRRIIDQIMSTPSPDFIETDREVAEITERVLAVRRNSKKSLTKYTESIKLIIEVLHSQKCARDKRAYLSPKRERIRSVSQLQVRA